MNKTEDAELINSVEAGEWSSVEVYPGQRIMVLSVFNDAYLVPYVENEEELFLKTIIPSRKATQQYFGEKHDD